ncbi:MAG: ABC transporter substrate-binding protein [Acetobacteraceae bacterium]|nr:ABC transporter substrate-binding protein [Acetobacteraceae bacterium]
MKRRHLLAASLGLAMPSVARSQAVRTLKFIPQSDVTVVDPIWTTAYNTRNHAFMVFDTLFGMDSAYQFQPQMLEGFTAEPLLWRLTLRTGLRFHDASPVLARDCVASIRRWAVRDALGGALMAATDELTAPDDRVIQFRLNKPFPLLPMALGKTSTPMCAMMPERLALTDPFKQVSEIIGSGPFRFKADERVSGARGVYTRFADYRPRETGALGWTAGPKITHFDRVEWVVIPDDGTAAAALQSGEVDWWELPPSDLMPALKRNGKIRVEIKDPTGVIGFLRMNCLIPPFDNPAIRRALIGAVDQQDYVTAIAGTDPANWRTGVGVFCPGTAMASDAGMDALTQKRDLAGVAAAIKAAGYTGTPVGLMVATDTNYRKAMGDVGAAMMRSVGMTVDYQAVDWGTVLRRRENRGPLDKGGWSAVFTTLSGLDMSNPSGHSYRGTGEKAWFGWPTAPKLETLRDSWMTAPDDASRNRLGADIQRQMLIDAPHIPIGQWFQPVAYRAGLDGMVSGFPIFWNVRKT